MAILQLRSKRKETGGRYKRPKVKRLARLGGLPVHTKIGVRKVKALRTLGANVKEKMLSAHSANTYDPKTKKHELTSIKSIVENPANRHYVRRNILTKGAVVLTEKGKARITSRPGQGAVANAVLVE